MSTRFPRVALMGVPALVLVLVVAVVAGAAAAWAAAAVAGASAAAVAIGWAFRRPRAARASTPSAPAGQAGVRKPPLARAQPLAAERSAEHPPRQEPAGEADEKPGARRAFPPPRGVPAPRREGPAPAPAPEVARLADRRGEARRWNLWELERAARAEGRRAPAHAGEWSYLFLHLRQFAEPEGTLPPEFDGLVRESFGNLLEQLEEA